MLYLIFVFQFVPLNISTAIKYLNQNDAILQLYLAFKQSQQYIGFFYVTSLYVICYMYMLYANDLLWANDEWTALLNQNV